MDIRRAIAAVPWLRRAWRVLPGPLRVPLLVIGAVVWLWRRLRGGSSDESGTPSEPPAAE